VIFRSIQLHGRKYERKRGDCLSIGALTAAHLLESDKMPFFIVETMFNSAGEEIEGGGDWGPIQHGIAHYGNLKRSRGSRTIGRTIRKKSGSLVTEWEKLTGSSSKSDYEHPHDLLLRRYSHARIS
jgi:hypothetical protein